MSEDINWPSEEDRIKAETIQAALLRLSRDERGTIETWGRIDRDIWERLTGTGESEWPKL